MARLNKPRGVEGVLTWNKFKKAVSEAAKKPRKKEHGPIENLNPNGPGSIYPLTLPPPADKRCAARTGKGSQCLKYAMRGATRCSFHGGHREVPAHKGTIRLLAQGEIDSRDQMIEARKQLYDLRPSREDVAYIRQIIRDKGQRPSPPRILEGIIAMKADSEGVAFRRWQKAMKLIMNQKREQEQ